MTVVRSVIAQSLTVILSALGVATLVFVLIRLAPGDPVVSFLGDYYSSATPQQIEEIRARIGVDQPISVQYVGFLGHLAQGDLGESFHAQEPVVDLISRNIGSTAVLIVAGMGIAVLIGIPIGIFAATHRNRRGDYLTMAASMVALAIPNFLLGIILIYVFGFYLHWLPMFGIGQGLGAIPYLVMPASVIGLRSAALIARMTRSTMLEVLGSDYVRTARAKGLDERRVLYVHALRNAAMPIITIVGTDLAFMMSGAVTIETVFSRPGLGKLLVDGMFQRDYPVVQGVMVVFAVGVTVCNGLVDLVYRIVDPRLRS